jgi:RNA polymerase sigma-70 factor (ECF subfamily)
MSPDPSFADLMARLRQGDEAAAAAIFSRFAQRLIALARRRLDGRVRSKEDPEDIVESVFKTFFRRHAQEPFTLDSWDNLWSLLTVIALRKCGYRTRYFRAACRDVQREAGPLPDSADSDASWEAIAHEPTPAEAAELTDTVEQLMRELDPRDRPILSLTLQGYTVPEIAAQIQRAERTVYRALERIRKRLVQLRAEETDAS